VDGKLEQISALIPHKDSLVSYIDTSKLKPGYQYTYCITQESTSHIAGKYSKPVYVTALSSRDPLPIAIQFTAQRDGKRAQLFWEDLRLQNKTILSYQLFRKSAADVGFVKLALISSHAHSYMDSTLQQGNEYLYGLSCIDAGGTMGTMAQSNTITYPSPEMPSVQGIRAFTEASATRLTWDKPLETTSVNKYNVYRYERDGAPVLLGSVTGAESQYIDNTAAKSTFYFYYITCVAYDGNEGLASIPVGIAH
jgi:fibronectin type 3 domain-containing protein